MENVHTYPKFTPEMKATHKILIPNMAPIHFEMMRAAMEDEGYHVEVLGSGGHAVAQEGLKYVHNDTCYPALLVIGQFINALKSGKYDLDHTALLITQTGGGCRASNYIHLLRKALVKAGFPQVPVASLNFSGLEKDSGFQLTLPLIRKIVAAVFYGDELMSLANQTRPYENEPGTADALVAAWTRRVASQFDEKKGFSKKDMAANFAAIAADFAAVPVTYTPKVKVGVVGEIYVKYSPLGNNISGAVPPRRGLRGEPAGPDGFCAVLCCQHGRDRAPVRRQQAVWELGLRYVLMSWLTVREKLMIAAIKKHPQFHAPTLFLDTKKMADGIIGIRQQDG